MEPITAMHHCLMAQKGQQVMLEDVEVRILNTLYNVLLRIARNLLETRENVKILTHSF